MSKLQVSRAKDRHFFIRTYLTELQIKTIILAHNVQHYAYILHDQDLKEDGEKVYKPVPALANMIMCYDGH